MSECEIVLHPDEIQFLSTDGADATAGHGFARNPPSGTVTPTSRSGASSPRGATAAAASPSHHRVASPLAPRRLQLVRAGEHDMQPRWGIQYPITGVISRDAVVTIQQRLADLSLRPQAGEHAWSASQWMLFHLLEEVIAEPGLVMEDLGRRRPPWANCSRCAGTQLGQHLGRAAGCRFNEYNDNLYILCPVCLGLSAYRGEFKGHCRRCSGWTERAFRVLWLAARVRTGDARKQCPETNCDHVTTVPAIGCVHARLHRFRGTSNTPPVTLPPLFQWQRDGDCIAPPEDKLTELLQAVVAVTTGNLLDRIDLRISQRQLFEPQRHSLAAWLRRHPGGPQLPGASLTLFREPPVHAIPLPPGPPVTAPIVPPLLSVPPPPLPPRAAASQTRMDIRPQTTTARPQFQFRVTAPPPPPGWQVPVESTSTASALQLPKAVPAPPLPPIPPASPTSPTAAAMDAPTSESTPQPHTPEWPALIAADLESPAAKTRVQAVADTQSSVRPRPCPIRLGARGRPRQTGATPVIPRETGLPHKGDHPRDPRLTSSGATQERVGDKRSRSNVPDPLGQDDGGCTVLEPTSEDPVSTRPESPPPPPSRTPVTFTTLLGVAPSYTGPLCTRSGETIGRVGLAGQLTTGRYVVRARDTETLHLRDARAASWQAEARPEMEDPIPVSREKLHAHLYATRRTSGVYAGKLVLTSRLKDCNWFELRRVGDFCDTPVRGVVMRFPTDK